eukprot:TRINITY_DN112344_c0_g1_i1.p1 TRINITY_DN112344_c0_g1~~TRINITY_DN112344_c0_g1_i1.p1  ORF type:complete len:339 (+),score=68.11 TRINITY_DN112344_c0_g1_i1:124-1140(+)
MGNGAINGAAAPDASCAVHDAVAPATILEQPLQEQKQTRGVVGKGGRKFAHWRADAQNVVAAGKLAAGSAFFMAKWRQNLKMQQPLREDDRFEDGMSLMAAAALDCKALGPASALAAEPAAAPQPQPAPAAATPQAPTPAPGRCRDVRMMPSVGTWMLRPQPVVRKQQLPASSLAPQSSLHSSVSGAKQPAPEQLRRSAAESEGALLPKPRIAAQQQQVQFKMMPSVGSWLSKPTPPKVMTSSQQPVVAARAVPLAAMPAGGACPVRPPSGAKTGGQGFRRNMLRVQPAQKAPQEMSHTATAAPAPLKEAAARTARPRGFNYLPSVGPMLSFCKPIPR